MTLQSNFVMHHLPNISAVQASPSRHISSSLPEVKLLQNKEKERGKTLQYCNLTLLQPLIPVVWNISQLYLFQNKKW